MPPELIAQHPAARRDASRMLVVHRTDGRLEHRTFPDLTDYLRRGDLLVVNNTRVIPARLFGRKPGSGGRVELFLLEETAPGEWEILLRAKRRPAAGGSVELADGASRAWILAYGEEGRARVRFEMKVPLPEFLERFGQTPLPPYIKRPRPEAAVHREEQAVDADFAASTVDARDRERYQTIFARKPGAVAAPTAGLHFTPDVLQRLADLGVDRAEVTLHVGIGTFRPVKVDRVEDHRMEEERYEVPASTAQAIRAAREAGGRVIAVGSTSVRTLETVAAQHGEVTAAQGRSELFIYPPYRFRAVDALLTNFHLPQSTLLMMVCALAGKELILRAYAEAVKERYRFFSYGDCMLIV